MVAIGASDTDTEILQKLSRIEETLVHGLNRVEQQLGNGKEAFQFFRDGLEAYREKHLQGLTKAPDPLSLLWRKIRSDAELRFPHRKLLEALAKRYDFQEKRFEEIHFSKLVSEARVGKNKAKEYLSLLQAKSLIAARTDGYRKFYRIEPKQLDARNEAP